MEVQPKKIWGATVERGKRKTRREGGTEKESLIRAAVKVEETHLPQRLGCWSQNRVIQTR